MTSAVIVAAGRGIRMETHQDKLFLEVEGLPVVGHTWKQFGRHPEIDETILVIRDDAREHFEKLAGQLDLTKAHSFALGGNERQDSVISGISAVHAECKIVAIQDGARPCTSPATISSAITAARVTGAAVASCKVTDTIKLADDNNHIIKNVDRANLWAVQTPQVFQLKVIQEAMVAVRDIGAIISDDTAACEFIGQSVTLVPSKTQNPKVTTTADLPLVQLLLRQQPH